MPKSTTSAIAAAIISAIVLAVFSLPAGVAAHAALARSDPAAGQTLAEPPPEIRLEFTEPLETTFTGADLLDGSGLAVPGVMVTIAPEDDHQLVIVPPGDLPEGGYTVAWRTLSAADGHTLQGYFGFRVGEGAPGTSAPPLTAMTGNDTARALSRGLALIGLAALLAIAPVTLLVLDPARRAALALDTTLPAHLRRYTAAAAALAILGSVSALVAQAATVAPDRSLPAALAQTLAETRYGQLWLLRLLLLLIAIGLAGTAYWTSERWRDPALLAGAALAAIMPLPFSLLSHAAAQDDGRTAAVANDALHLLAASIWAGGLFLLALVLAPAVRNLPPEERRSAWRAAIPRFSVIGLAAWAVLALSGLYAAWLQVGTLEALRETPYGQSLLLKLVLLGPILALAAYHLFLGNRGLQGRGGRRLALTIGGEALVVLIVLLVVGRLIGLEPARAVLAARTPSQIVVPLAFATNQGERTASLAISPGAAGVNTFTLEIAGSPLPEGSEGVLRFDFPAQAMGAQELRLPGVSTNRFRSDGPELALPGDWQIEVIVRAIGQYSWSRDIVLPIAQTPPPMPAPNPAPVFAPAAIAGMAIVALGAVALAVAVVAAGAVDVRRLGIAAFGVVAAVAGGAIMSQTRLPPASAPSPVVAQAAPSAATAAAVADGHAEMMSHHATPHAGHATPEPQALPGPGATVDGDSFTISIAAEPGSAGPVDVAVTLRAADDAPLGGARVVVLSDMPEMTMGRMETPAVETAPGEYVAELVPLTMAGEWRLAIRVSPRGAATQTFSFAVDVP